MKTYKGHDIDQIFFTYTHIHIHVYMHAVTVQKKKRDCIGKAGRGMCEGLEGERGRKNVKSKL